MNHASSRSSLPARSLPARSPWLALGLAVVVGGASVASAAVVSIDRPAEVTRTAERLPTPTTAPADGLRFPIDPEPRCEVLNNWGGHSKRFGAGAHQGVDIGAELGQEVYAVEDGVLYRQFDGAGSGLGWGLLSETDVKYRYFHLAALADGLEVGDPVEGGQVIGVVGDTGNASPGGWHLHFEVRPGPAPHRTTVDPVPLLAIPDACIVY